MSLTRAINRYGAFFFMFVAMSAIAGFWPGYLSQISDEPDATVHIHGTLLSLWLAMLIAQGLLIRTNRRQLHRQLGKLSYVLAPLVFISIATIKHNNMSGADNPFDAEVLRLLFWNAFGQPLTFALTYGLAIFHRRDSATHARFMLCTVIPSAGPIFNRVMISYMGLDSALAFNVTAAAVFGLLAVVSFWDWSFHRRLNVFPVVFGWMLALTVLNGLFAGSSFQLRVAQWYLPLPLS